MVTPIKDASVFDQWFCEIIRSDASDLFLFPDEPPAYRLRGKIERTDTAPLSASQIGDLAEAAFGKSEVSELDGGTLKGICSLSLLNHPDMEEILRNRFGSHASPNRPVRFLVALGRSLGQFSIAVRVCPYALFPPERLDVPEPVIAASNLQSGLILFSGPVGSGKVTSAAALVDHVNATRSAQICVVGDPVLYVFEPKQCLVQHKEVGIDAPSTLAGIRAAYEQDVDILFVTDLRTEEEIEACLMVAANSLVITQVHARSPEDALDRLIDVFPPEMHEIIRRNLAGVLRCVVCQRLFPRANGKGRLPAYGVLIPDTEMRQMIVQGQNLRQRQSPLPQGCQSLADQIAQLQAGGLISEEEAKRKLEDIW